VQLRLHELHYNLGHVLHQQGDLAGAAACFKQVLAIAPGYINAHNSLGVVLDEQGQQDAAISHYRQAIALDPSSIRAYNNLGCSLAKLNRHDEAIAAYRQAIALQDNWAILHNNLGQVLVERDAMAAVAAYRRAIELEPTLALAHHNLGRALQSQGQHQRAIGHFQQAIQLRNDLYAAKGGAAALVKSRALAFSDGASSWIALGQWDLAFTWLRQAIEPDLNRIEAYCDWAAQLPASDELSQARMSCAQFLQMLLQPDSANSTHFTDRQTSLHASLVKTYFHLGNVLTTYGGEGQYQQAEKYYQQALKLQPTHPDLLLKLANCLAQQERFNAALLVCQLALSAEPHQPIFYAQMGNILEQQQQWQAAIDYYQQALQASQKTTQKTTQKAATLGQQTLNSPAQRPLQKQNRPTDRPIGTYLTTQQWHSSNPDQGRYIALSPLSPLSHSLKSSLSPAALPAACAGLNCSPCLKQIFERFKLAHLGHGIHTYADPCESSVLTEPLFTAILAEGQAWAMPQQNSWQICNAIAILTPDHSLLADLSEDYPGKLPGCQHVHADRHRIFSEKMAAPEPIRGRVAALAGLSGHNYFHWMVDILPRLELLRQSGIAWDTIDWFWINNIDQPFQQQTLAALGIPLEKVLVSDRHPFIQADFLIVPSFAGHLGWSEPWAIEFLRQTFLPVAASSHIDLPKRIYISRTQAHHRLVLNEAAVLQQLLPLGFVSVTLENLSFAEQVALFAQADVIIAPHGGGLTNILFCRPGTTIVELVAPSYIRHYYWVISHSLKLHPYLLADAGVTCYPIRQLMYPSPLTEDIWVDLDALKILLSKLSLA
jgi:tetratricopeptide (TPR) repeat protein/capsular polysaccharide biosynthesis protein